MSYKDDLRKAQGAMGDIPKLKIEYNIDVRENPKDAKSAVFTFYQKGPEDEEAKIVSSKSPIIGIYIGSAMKLTRYSDDIGAKGGKYFSSVYFKNDDMITLFEPQKKGKPIKKCAGTVKGIEEWFGANQVIGSTKKYRVIYVLTKGGLVKIETNATLAIDDFKKIEKDLLDKFLILTPSIYDPEDKTISKQAKEYLGPFAPKNPPKYAHLTLGELIDDNTADKWGVTETLKDYIAWKDFKLRTGRAIEVEEQGGVHGEAARENGNMNRGDSNPYRAAQGGGPELSEDPPDDLPF